MIQAARATGCNAAIVSSAASASAIPLLQQNGIHSVLLVHELPRLLREKELLETLRRGLAAADAVVFPAELVRDRCFEALGMAPTHSVVLPQGIACHRATPEERATIRAELHVPPGASLALGMGYADLRKGFDLFLQVWRVTRTATPPICLVWAGGIDPSIEAYLGAEIAAAEAHGSFRFLGPRSDAGALLAAADVFFGIM